MKRIVGLVVAIALTVPGAAFAAGGSTCQSYNPQLCSSVGNNAQGGTGQGTKAGSTSASTLPFTGVDVGLLAAGGAVLLGAGLVVRRLSGDLN